MPIATRRTENRWSCMRRRMPQGADLVEARALELPRRHNGTPPANTTLTGGQLASLFQFRQTPTGPYSVAASAIGADGRAVAADGKPPFSGQVLFPDSECMQPAASWMPRLMGRVLRCTALSTSCSLAGRMSFSARKK